MWSILMDLLSNLFFAILHVAGAGSFPKPLTAKEELDCLERMKQGDAEARGILIERNLRLVAHIIKKYYAGSNDQDDLISIGTIGLIKAVDSFNPGKGIRLSSYASRCIENEILMFFRSGKKNAQDISMSEPIETDKDGNTLTLIDTMATEDNIVEILDEKMKSEQLHQFVVECLEPRERMIIVLRYGLSGNRPLPQREVAKRLEISRSYVSMRAYCKRIDKTLFFTRGYLKSRNYCLFLQSTAATALKILGIHQGFLRFLPCICLLLAENSSIS